MAGENGNQAPAVVGSALRRGVTLHAQIDVRTPGEVYIEFGAEKIDMPCDQAQKFARALMLGVRESNRRVAALKRRG